MDNAMHFTPPEPDVEAYAGGEKRAIYAQCVAIAEAQPTHTRAFMKDAARAVGRRFCLHSDDPPRVLRGNTPQECLFSLEEGHSDLCGVH